jgi:hypothetical protein
MESMEDIFKDITFENTSELTKENSEKESIFEKPKKVNSKTFHSISGIRISMYLEMALKAFSKDKPTFKYSLRNSWNDKKSYVEFYYAGLESKLTCDIIDEEVIFEEKTLGIRKTLSPPIDERVIISIVQLIFSHIYKAKRLDNLYNPPKYYFHKVYGQFLKDEKQGNDLFTALLKHHKADNIEEYLALVYKNGHKVASTMSVGPTDFYLLKIIEQYFILQDNLDGFLAFDERESAVEHYSKIIREETDRLLLKNTSSL